MTNMRRQQEVLDGRASMRFRGESEKGVRFLGNKKTRLTFSCFCKRKKRREECVEREGGKGSQKSG
jgi:hypothetical protein